MNSQLSAHSSPAQIRFGSDVREACARIHRWSRLLAFVGIVSIVMSAFIALGLWMSGDDPVLIALAAALVASAVVTLVPTLRMSTMSRAFGAVAFPATLYALVDPLRRLRSVLFWFVLIGAVGQLVVLVVGIAYVAVPSLLQELGIDKPSKTAASMRAVALAIDDYAHRNHTWPEASDYEQLREHLRAAGVNRELPLTDAWGRPFHYKLELTRLGPKYTLMSLGADGARQFPDAEAPPPGPAIALKTDHRDLVIESGVFVEGPARFLGIVREETAK